MGLKQSPSTTCVTRGALLYGPSGCGKTLICQTLANSLKVHTIVINSSDVFRKYFGETEKNLQKHFDTAFAAYPKPTLVILEDVNLLCPRNETNEMTRRVSMTLLDLLDTLHTKKEASRTFIMATTTDIEDLNPSIRKCRRLDYDIEVGVPKAADRLEILRKCLERGGTAAHNISEEDLRGVADVCHGFVGADLMNLMSKAALCAVRRSSDRIELMDINNSLSMVKPSAMREVLIETPNVRWNDIGGQDELKEKLKQSIEWPFLYAEKFERFGIKAPCGLLMFGPPGCSKTMIAKALATESHLNFLSIKGPELFSMWVGESERAVREVFRRARQGAPAIIFFDEIDAIGGERASDGGGGSSVKERVLAQLLTELDGVVALKNVVIVAATNRPDMIDKALMRPGRIDRIVYVGLPDGLTRKEIFRVKLQRMPIEDDVDLEILATATDGYSGAEIQAVCQEAALFALQRDMNCERVAQSDFVRALDIVKQRTDPQLLNIYEEFLKRDK